MDKQEVEVDVGKTIKKATEVGSYACMAYHMIKYLLIHFSLFIPFLVSLIIWAIFHSDIDYIAAFKGADICLMLIFIATIVAFVLDVFGSCCNKEAWERKKSCSSFVFFISVVLCFCCSIVLLVRGFANEEKVRDQIFQHKNVSVASKTEGETQPTEEIFTLEDAEKEASKLKIVLIVAGAINTVYFIAVYFFWYQLLESIDTAETAEEIGNTAGDVLDGAKVTVKNPFVSP